MKTRELDILNIVTKEESIEVSRLAEMLKVSAVTVRKTLDSLESRKLIRREHGFALAISKDDINNRLAVNHEIKQRIGREAVKMVSNGETIMIESGSCCAILAERLVNEKQNVTIITNSAFIADFIRKKPTAKVILLGGEYQNEAQVMVGTLVRKCVESFCVDKFFIGTDGFSSNIGFTGKNLDRSEAVQNMSQHANRVIILTDSSKFRQQGVVNLLPTRAIDTLITDEGIDQKTENLLHENDVKIVKVSGIPSDLNPGNAMGKA